MKEKVRELFQGHGTTARLFRFGLLAFDLSSIAYFLYSSTLEIDTTIIVIDAILGCIMTSIRRSSSSMPFSDAS